MMSGSRLYLYLSVLLTLALCIGAKCDWTKDKKEDAVQPTTGSSGEPEDIDTWQNQSIDSSGSEGAFPSMAVDHNGKIHISYLDNTNSDLKYATNLSGTWFSTTIDSTGSVGAYSSLAIDTNNNAHVAYYDVINRDLKYATNQTGAWVRTTLDSAGMVGAWCSLALDGNNKSHISYADETNGDLKYATNISGTWATYTIDSPGVVGIKTSIAVDGNNKAHIAYYDATNKSVKYATNSSGNWLASTVASASNSTISIKVGTNNKAYIAYDNSLTKSLKCATNAEGENWVITTIDENAAIPSLTIDSQNKLYVSYYDLTNNCLKYATNAGGGGWVVSTIDSNYHAGEFSSIGIGADNTVSIAYYDANNQDLKYATTSQETLPEVTVPTAPSPPSSLTATVVSSFRIDINWTDNANNETGFTLERKIGAGGTYQAIATPGVDTVTYADSSLTEGTRYYYRIKALNSVGSSSYSAETNALTILNSPSNLQATVISSTRIALAWADNSGGETGYKIERKTGAGGTYGQITSVGANVMAYSDNSVVDGEIYYYRVRAYNADGNSIYSGETNSPVSLNAPTALTASTISATQINLSWNDNSKNETGYKIERKIGTGGIYALITTTMASVISYSNTALVDGTVYYYKIKATNANGDSSYSGEANTATILAQPTGLTAVAVSATQINLGWSDNSNSELNYKIERKTGAGGTYGEIASVGADITSYPDSGLTEGTLYFYRVKTSNALGDSAYSGEVSALSTMGPPSLLQATVISSTRINLTWNDNTNTETGYKVERKTGALGAYGEITSLGVDTEAYQDNTVVDGATYYYRVRAYNADGESSYSNEASPAIPLNAPTVLTANTTSSTQINLGWTDNSLNETNFKVERKTGAGGTYGEIVSLGANTTSYPNIGLVDGTLYYYKVKATNASGESSYSNEAFAVTVLNPPTSLQGNAVSYSQVNLNWNDNSGSETGYKIERKAGAGGTYNQITTTNANATSYPDTGLTDGITYYYKARATNTNTDSVYCDEISVAMLLSPPTGLSATAASATQINIGWLDNSNSETSYKIERKTGAGGAYEEVASVGANITSYPDTGLTEGTLYYYRVRASNAIGNSAYSGEANATTPLNPPTALTTTVLSSSQVRLNWEDNSNSELGYKIERKTGLGGIYGDIGLASIDITVFTNTGTSPETIYYYRIKAYNANTESNYSNEVSAATSLGTPTGLATTPLSQTSIRINWSDNSDNESEYWIERSSTGGGINFSQIATVTASTSIYNDTGLTANTTYYYRVRGYSVVFGISAYSGEASGTTWDNPPAAPTNLIAKGQALQIVITWTDNANNETGFKIERGPDGTNFNQIDTTGANITAYTDAPLALFTTYYYRVRSYNIGGNSTYSNVISATTKAGYLGTGADGALNVPAGNTFNINTQTNGVNGRAQPDGWCSRISSLTANTAVLNTVPPVGTFVANDEVIIISVKGTVSSTNIGNYEFMRVQSVAGNVITFDDNKIKFYGETAGQDNNLATSQYVMLQRVPNYTNVTVNWTGTLTCENWNGITGGVVAFRANGTVSVGSTRVPVQPNITASITASGKGHRGGTGTDYDSDAPAGETYCGGLYNSGGNANGGVIVTPAPGGGGGGGGATTWEGDGARASNGTTGPAGGGGGAAYTSWGAWPDPSFGGGGGGGGYGSVGLGGLGFAAGSDGAGVTGGNGGSSDLQSWITDGGGGGGGGTYGNSAQLNSKIYFGAGGGAGGGAGDADTDTSLNGGSGGKGGGFVYITANTLNVFYNFDGANSDSGYIIANGGDGESVDFLNFSTPGGGGGGAGGSVVIKANSIINQHANGITAKPGAGGTSNGGYNGSNGGGGRTYAEYNIAPANLPTPNYAFGGAPQN
ncbi:MAG: fibronectin type III domain-containing protein [Planctomycetes bacterium]|nr:fibronectin type III domain-containing protein [Planctomycetota bacterium]